MRPSGPGFVLSATDLANFLGCRHRTALDMAEARGTRRRPHFDDPLLDIRFQRGRDHERSYVESLAARGLTITDLRDHPDAEQSVNRTLEAMRSGADVIVQGALSEGSWYGLPDVLERVELASALGDWSYQVADTKLARETRAGTILQLCLYSEMLGTAQGRPPELFHVVTPDPITPRLTYRFDDYAAYFRLIRDQLQQTARRDPDVLAAEHYPEPVDLCDICPWSSECASKRRTDDHLSLVAGISRIQRRELESRGVRTLTGLARLAVPLTFDPDRGNADGYLRVREQARVQLESRGRTPPVHELLACEAGKGLARLPEPCPGDVFLDLEGDLFAREGGREYLFGVVTIGPDGTPRYRSYWGFTDQEERVAFEAVIDLIMQSWAAHDGMHVYHYAPYEPSALKRLMGRYASRGAELDRLLRAERLVDLYTVVRQGVRAGIEGYSIKNLEPLYGFERTIDLRTASRCLVAMEVALELNATAALPHEVRSSVEGYNRDDCVSTLHLRDWLERQRAQFVAGGTPVPRPTPSEGDANEEVDARAARVESLRSRLLDRIPEQAADRNEEQQARWIIAYLLDWHRREDRVSWWEYFRLRELPEQALFDEPRAVAGLEFVERLTVIRQKKTNKPTGSVIDRYRFPAQEIEIRPRDELHVPAGSLGHVIAVSRDAGTIDVRKGPARADEHPTAAFAHTHFSSKEIEEGLWQLGDRVAADHGLTMTAGSSDRAARDLLLRAGPRLLSRRFRGGDPSVAFAIETVLDLDYSLLAIQGPPGSGKTYCGAQMICALVKRGRKVGVTATSHKVIANLFTAVREAAKQPAIGVRLGHKCESDDGGPAAQGTRIFEDNAEAAKALDAGAIDVLGGTVWLWARPEFAQTVDVLFVDEAGQMSLANVIAASRAAKSLVLLGDPQQLEQPTKGAHPESVDSSALQYVLGTHLTMPADRGIFLPTTRRLAPSICSYTSEVFYEGKLHSLEGLERQRLSGAGDFDGNGLWVVEVDHDGNRNYSDEEVDVIERLVARLTATGVRWTDVEGKTREMKGRDILVVSPYNAQVGRLADRLGHLGVAAGTVDKFQGQEAPVVIYSMATSRPEDAPRGMEFLYSPNRLNVATSRARSVAIVVANPRLFQPDCRSPRQMRLANALCRFRELAGRITE